MINIKLNNEDQNILDDKEAIQLSDLTVDGLINNTKLEQYKEKIKKYCYDNYKKELLENEKDRIKDPLINNDKLKTKLYRFASTLINTMNWNYFYGKGYDGNYKGRHLHCHDCKYFNDPLATYCNGTCTKIKEKYPNTNIQVNKTNDICSNFINRIQVTYNKEKYNSLHDYLDKTNKLKNITFKDWKREKLEYCSFKDYIHFLNNSIYIDYKGDSTIKYKNITLHIDDKTLFIPLNNNYFNLDFIKDNKIYCNKLCKKSKKRNKTYDELDSNLYYELQNQKS